MKSVVENEAAARSSFASNGQVQCELKVGRNPLNWMVQKTGHQRRGPRCLNQVTRPKLHLQTKIMAVVSCFVSRAPVLCFFHKGKATGKPPFCGGSVEKATPKRRDLPEATFRYPPHSPTHFRSRWPNKSPNLLFTTKMIQAQKVQSPGTQEVIRKQLQ